MVNVLLLTDLNAVPGVAAAAAAATSAQRPEEIMESTTDAEEWRMEVEKVAPQLKVTVRVDNRDWRTHLEQMHSYRTGIEEALTTTKVQLDKLHSDIARTLEKIGSREKYLNSQLEGGFILLVSNYIRKNCNCTVVLKVISNTKNVGNSEL